MGETKSQDQPNSQNITENGDNSIKSNIERNRPSNLMTLSFIISSFTTQPSGIITSLLLIEIGLTFGVTVGVMGQMRTTASIVGVFVALSLGIISIRFSSRSILLVGSLLLILAAAGCAIAWDFPSMLAIFSLTGIGITMIAPMINTMIGDNYPNDRRAKILGLSAAGTSIAFLVCSPLVSYISGTAGWRMVFILIMLPTSVIGLLIASIGIPKDSKKISRISDLLSGYRSVLAERSAVFCLIGTMFCWTAFLGSLTYMMSFYRQQFLLELGWASVLLSIFALSKTLGHLTIGTLVDKFGRKTIVVSSVFSMSLFIVGYLYSPTFWLSVPVACISCILAGYMHSSVDSLNLEQIPNYRSSMMSLSYAFYTMGGVLGAGIGGFAILIGGYGALATILGFFGLVSGIIFYEFAVDPKLPH
jgi:predicted MFS family arabinose efflux permease